MKKSNKILLAIFLTAFLVLGGIHVSLMAKYKSGEFAAYQEEDQYQDYNNKPLAKNSQIKLENIDVVMLVLSDTPRLRYNEDVKGLTITESGGVITIAAPERKDEMQPGIKVQLHLDSTIMVALKNSNAYLKEGGSTQQHLNISLDHARFGTTDQTEASIINMNSLSIKAANESEVALNHLRIQQCSISLQKSALHEIGSTINQFTLQADDSSRIAISSANFLKTTKTNINE